MSCTRSLNEEVFPALEKKMEEAVKRRERFERLEISVDDAKELFASNRFKQRILTEKVEAGSTITAYRYDSVGSERHQRRCGYFIDLCRGPHLPDLGRVKSLALIKNSSAYWMGKADQEVLQRVYGVTFPSKDLMKEWKVFQEEAAKRDHRIIGKVWIWIFLDYLVGPEVVHVPPVVTWKCILFATRHPYLQQASGFNAPRVLEA